MTIPDEIRRVPSLAQVIEVAVPLPLEKTYHYLVPAGLVHRIATGRRVFVPFGGRRLSAYILGTVECDETGGLKEIIDVIDDEPLWTENELDFSAGSPPTICIPWERCSRPPCRPASTSAPAKDPRASRRP